jgi:phage gpG-like protein
MITAQLIGREELIRKFLTLGPATRKSLKTSFTALVYKLQAKVKRDKLSGQVLSVRTGTLRRSIYGKVVETNTFIYGIVGTNVKYAAAHEYGFTGQVTVKEHLRKITKAYGKDLAEPRSVMVMAYSRKMNLPERSFLRSALADMQPEITQTLESSLRTSLKGLL